MQEGENLYKKKKKKTGIEIDYSATIPSLNNSLKVWQRQIQEPKVIRRCSMSNNFVVSRRCLCTCKDTFPNSYLQNPIRIRRGKSKRVMVMELRYGCILFIISVRLSEVPGQDVGTRHDCVRQTESIH